MRRTFKTKMKSALTSAVRIEISAFLVLLLFTLYMALLYVSGFFNDWQELVTEPYFLLRGLKNYTDIATHHAPLLTEFLAVIYRFVGTSIMARMVLLFLVSLVITFLIYRATHRLADKNAGLYSILLFTIFWPFYGGTNFWFDTFLPMFYLTAFVIMIEKRSPKWLFLAGISMGLSFLIKQPGGIVALGMLFMLLARAKNLKNCLKESLLFSSGVLVPIAIMVLWFAYTEQLRDAIYWMLEYNFSKHYVGLGKKQPPIADILRLIAIIVPIMLLLAGSAFSKTTRQLLSWNFLLALVMGFCASFTIFPRWERWHVAPSVPFLVISLVVSFKLLLTPRNASNRTKSKNIILKIVLTLWLSVVIVDVGTFYPPMLIQQFIPNFSRLWPLRSYDPPSWYDENFIRYVHDLQPLGKYLQKISNKADRIFVWGWLGNKIYFEADRLPAGKFYYNLPWFTCLPRFKRDLLIGFERDHPRFVIVAKRPFPGTPTLAELGIDLNKRGYKILSDLENRFPEVVIWKSCNP